jgi:hypothetical protein
MLYCICIFLLVFLVTTEKLERSCQTGHAIVRLPKAFTWYCVWVQQVISDLYRITEVHNVNSIFPPKFICTVPNPSCHHRPEAEFLDKIQTKSEEFSSSLFADTSTSLLEMSISPKSNFKLLTISVKEKGGNLIENHNPFPMV